MTKNDEDKERFGDWIPSDRMSGSYFHEQAVNHAADGLGSFVFWSAVVGVIVFTIALVFMTGR